METLRPAIGIDLGTTNSAIAVWQDGKAYLIPNAHGQDLTPSIVCIGDDNTLLVGQAAATRLLTDPSNTASHFKRFLGSERRYRLGKEQYTPTELCALVLGSLKADAEVWLGHEVYEVVISVPAYFGDQQRKQVRLAADLAGLDAVRLINEPTAAAMAYSLHEQHSRRFLVFDLGGGTFDVTVVEYQDGIMEVRASAGDNRLGGEDFTQDLVDAVLDQLGTDRSDMPLSQLGLVYLASERAKRHRSGSCLEVELGGEWNRTLRFSEIELAGIWRETLNRLRKPLSQALSDARLHPEEVDELIFVGGASRQSEVQQTAVRLLGRFGRHDLDPDRVVAIGAAIQAACRLRDSAVEELIMTDVCPFTLGIEVSQGDQHGIFSPILERNTVVPASRVERYRSGHEQQKAVSISIYQGERFWVRDNLHVDNLEIPLPTGKGIQEVDVRFSYDINGMLEVDVTLVSTGELFQKVIDRSPAGVTEERKRESRERLARLKHHPRDALPNLTLSERLEQLYEESTGNERRQIEQWLLQFERVLAGQDPQLIRSFREEMNALLKQWH
ncbi:molecular chaperone HscC [Aeromonas salmonicida subsp. salmonicida]|uniref:Molecular chaperone, hsp70 family n=2 Tax=Aeromonas salmonicida subsp. salmonicida TaxID=29491 RepID=A4SK45_AERS4|nr:molecular chaperone HscC [Aeromonas salmonicida]ABO89267.1 Molecular chaperone, hsp70 family [Aeromonas salmonicida subsp. salmonicida A449]AYO62388.1 molecular chaperone HscC [Aeromonas salmonicida subsp. salmonicida 01-B526]EHI51721.1 HSP70 family molecular chaperone [Aeromonas salmonicida subsp. salmonicida 01-B526]EKP0240678.1 molecular chaperone HscC [Aeromonas salmonicida]EKP0244805.1 molecular chaperone HscC [Aeromonas salmonicida]